MMNQLKTVILLGALTAVLVGLGGTLAPGYLYVFLFLALAMNLGAYYFSDRIVLRMHRAQETSPQQAPRLHRVVEELATRAGIPKPRVFVIPEPQPNALATGRNPEHGVVAVTSGILERLSERELRGVLAHELGHIKNRDILIASIAAAIATAVSYLANILQFGALFGVGRSDDDEGGSPLAMLAMAIIAPLAATLIQLSISRSREFLADESAAHLSADPEALASALEKLERGAASMPMHAQPATASLFIVSPFSGRGGMTKLFSTHPPMAERIAKLRTMARGGNFVRAA